MARATAGVGFGTMSGAMGNVIFAQTQDGMVARERTRGNRHRSPAQMVQDARMAFANYAWRSLTFEQATEWRAYAQSLATRNPATGGLRVPPAYGLFAGLSMKYMQAHGGTVAPSLPPEGRFNGDLLNITIAGGINQATFTADRTNAPGVLTEILAQRLKGPNNLPKAKSYVSIGFFSFAAGVPTSVHIPTLGTWAFATCFVEASSGRMTDLVEIGRATITGNWADQE